MNKNKYEPERFTNDDVINYALADLTDRHESFKDFQNDFMNCPKLVLKAVESPTEYYLMYVAMLQKVMVVLKGQYYLNDALNSEGYSIHAAAFDWDYVDVQLVPFESYIWTTLDNWSRQAYHAPNMGPLGRYVNDVGGTQLYHEYIDLSSWTIHKAYTLKQIFINFGLEDMYRNLKKDRTRSSAAAQYDSAWSEAMWPELLEIRSAYIDNVAVFVPDYCTIDYNLSHSLGSDLLGLQIVRPPNSDLEKQLFDAKSLESFLRFLFAGGASQIPSGSPSYTPVQGGYDYETGQSTPVTGGGAKGGANYGGAAQGMINIFNFVESTVQKWIGRVRIIYPRIRAFGRQEKIFTYGLYDRLVRKKFWNMKEIDVNGKKILVDKDAANTWGKIPIQLTKEVFDAFYGQVKDYVEATLAGVIG